MLNIKSKSALLLSIAFCQAGYCAEPQYQQKVLQTSKWYPTNFGGLKDWI